MLDGVELRRLYDSQLKREQIMNYYTNMKKNSNANTIVKANRNLIKYQMIPIIEDGIHKKYDV